LWTSTLCTLTGLTVREVQERAALQPLAASATEEARGIARALGVAVERAPRRPSGALSSGASHKPSMLQDYERGRPMEIEAQLIAPLELARMAKVNTPTLDVLVPLLAAKAAAKGLFTH
jgi:2-dehydropantoate 2-reductase